MHFFTDALTLQSLEITLIVTVGSKAIGMMPMAGITHRATERYCAELIRLNYNVAL